MLQLTDIGELGTAFSEQLELYKVATNESFDNQLVIEQIKRGKAFVFSENGDLEIGWVILVPSVHYLTKKKYLEAWLAYSRRGNVIVDYTSEIEHLALEIEAEYVEFSTEFLALARLSEQVGFKPAFYTYRKEL